MTVFYNLFDSGTNGTVMTTANTGGANGTAFTALTPDCFFSTEQAHSGGMSMKMGAAGGSAAAYGRWADAVPAANGQAKKYFYFTAVHSADYALFEVRGDTSSSTRKMSVYISSGNKLRMGVSGQASTTVWTSTADFPINQHVRVEVLYETGTNDTNGRVRTAMFLGESTTPVEDSGWITGMNMRFSITPTVSQIYVGKNGTNAYAGSAYMDTVRVRTGADYTGTFIGPETVPLATPVVSLGSFTNPTTVGGTNGTQQVTWPAVSGATSYVAYLASGASPAQGDFVQVATGVTSPYTFTGLSAGTYSYGIKAKA